MTQSAQCYKNASTFGRNFCEAASANTNPIDWLVFRQDEHTGFQKTLCQNEANQVSGTPPISNEPNRPRTSLRLLKGRSRQDEANPACGSMDKTKPMGQTWARSDAATSFPEKIAPVLGGDHNFYDRMENCGLD